MTATTTTGTVMLEPSYKLAPSIIVLSVPLFVIQPFVGGFFALLGLFLLYQTTAIRLVFTPTDLEVRRNDTLLKTFPYAEWETWTLFWRPVPILFYFKEVNSIHFLPVLFDPVALYEQLEARCPLPPTP